MNNIVKIITPYNRTARANRDIRFLVFHYTGTLAPAVNNAKYYASQKVGASAHYYLDEGGTIYQGVEDKDEAWHCGTTGAYKHPVCRNANSIGIEMVPRKVAKGQMSAAETDWYFEQATVDNAVALGRMLMERYGIPIENVLRHYDVTGKICPNPFAVDSKAQAAWEDFKARLTAPEVEETDMTRDEVIALVREEIAAAAPRVYATLADVPEWGKPTVQRLMDAGALRGDEAGRLNLTEDLLRGLVIQNRVTEVGG